MKILIHAYPARMWHVNEYLIPALLEQGADPGEIEIWNDTAGLGNLRSCMDSFAARTGDGGTWHIQDDALPCRDFVKRCRQHDDGLVFGFCSPHFTDDVMQVGHVHMPDAWHSFQIVRIPDAWAREGAAWYFSGAWQSAPAPMLPALHEAGIGDDSFFREFLQERHGMDMALNLAPNLCEHVDFLIGGSAINKWRGFWVRAHYWEDEDLVDEFRAKMKARRKRLREAGLL